MAERTNALVLKTRGRKTPEGSNPSAPAHRRPRTVHITNLLKIIKIMKTFTFWFCTLWVLLGRRRQVQAAWRQRRQKEDWMKRVILLATVAALVAMLALAPMALAQGTTMMQTGSPSAGVPE